MSEFEHTQPSAPAPFVERRHKRPWLAFSRQLTLGDVFQAGVVLAGLVGGYGLYTASRAADQARFEKIEKEVKDNREQVKETLSDIRTSVGSMQNTLGAVRDQVTALKARDDVRSQMGSK